MPSSSAPARRAAPVDRAGQGRPADRADRERARRRAPASTKGAPHQDDGGECPGGLSRAPRRASTASTRAGAGGYGSGARAEADHRRKLPRRAVSGGSRPPKASISSSARRVSVAPRTVAVNGRALPGRSGLHQYRRAAGRCRRSRGWTRCASLDSTSIMELDQVPEHLIVLGGGYIGLEFGQMFRRFGSRVTVIQRGPPAAAAGGRGHRRGGARHPAGGRRRGAAGGRGPRAERTDDGGPGDDPRRRRGAGDRRLHVLLAAGRVPNTERLDLKAAGVETDAKGFIRVERTAGDQRRRASMPWAT